VLLALLLAFMWWFNPSPGRRAEQQPAPSTTLQSQTVT
jgi:hypothetical protein